MLSYVKEKGIQKNASQMEGRTLIQDQGIREGAQIEGEGRDFKTCTSLCSNKNEM